MNDKDTELLSSPDSRETVEPAGATQASGSQRREPVRRMESGMHGPYAFEIDHSDLPPVPRYPRQRLRQPTSGAFCHLS